MDDDIEALLAGISDDEKPSVPTKQQPVKHLSNQDPPNEFLDLERGIAALAAELKQLYGPRVPKLFELGLSARQLAGVIRILGNDPAIIASTDLDPLVAEVGSANALAVRLCLAEDAGIRLEDNVWHEVELTVSQILQLSTEWESLIDQAASEIPQKAPNLAQILEAHVAARLIAHAGGLRQLGLTSPANIVSLRTSPLLRDPLVDQVPDQFKKQAMRIVAGKAILAARMDNAGPVQSDTQGKLWRRQIEMRMDKLLAAPPSLQHRALPKPVDKKTSRRGGKRIRKIKEKQAPSKLAREQNYIRFGG